MILPIKLFSSHLFEVNGRLEIHQPGKLPEKKAMRSHPIELAGIDLPERLELKVLQIIASKNVSGIALIFFLELQIVEQSEQQLINLVAAHLFFLSSSLSTRTIAKS